MLAPIFAKQIHVVVPAKSRLSKSSKQTCEKDLLICESLGRLENELEVCSLVSSFPLMYQDLDASGVGTLLQ